MYSSMSLILDVLAFRVLIHKQQVDQPIEASLDRYFEQLEHADREERSVTEANTIPLKDKIAILKEEMQRLGNLEIQVLNAPDKQVSLTDPDARSMKSRGNMASLAITFRRLLMQSTI